MSSLKMKTKQSNVSASNHAISPPNEIMDHSNTALWTIPKFHFGEFLSFFLQIPKHLSTFSNSPDPDQRAPT